MRKRIFALWLLLLVLLAGMPAHASEPKMNAKITQKNVMALARATDADGAFILQRSVSRGKKILSWWSDADTIAAGMDTAVHEQFHENSLSRDADHGEEIYIGNKKYCRVNYTKVFPSSRMAAAVPKRLRSYRWADYIGSPEEGMFSDEMGVYGLLNEFAAYYWGMHAQMSLMDYFVEQKATLAQWEEFAVSCANDRMAYAEFRCYILKYLQYAKQQEPAVYRGIVNNRAFVKAYQTIDRKFAALIREFEDRTGEIEALLKEQGYQVRIGDSFRVIKNGGYRDTDLFGKDYRKLLSETKKTACQGLLIGGSGSGERLKSPSLLSAKRSSGGMAAVRWSGVSKASGYQICYSADRNFSAVKTVGVKAAARSKKLFSLKKNQTYYVKICAFRTDGEKTEYSPWSRVIKIE